MSGQVNTKSAVSRSQRTARMARRVTRAADRIGTGLSPGVVGDLRELHQQLSAMVSASETRTQELRQHSESMFAPEIAAGSAPAFDECDPADDALHLTRMIQRAPKRDNHPLHPQPTQPPVGSPRAHHSSAPAFAVQYVTTVSHAASLQQRPPSASSTRTRSRAAAAASAGAITQPAAPSCQATMSSGEALRTKRPTSAPARHPGATPQMVIEAAAADPAASERLARAQLLEALHARAHRRDVGIDDGDDDGLQLGRVMHGPTPAVTDGGPTIRDAFAPKTNPGRLGLLEARRGGTKPDPGLRGTVARPPTGKSVSSTVAQAAAANDPAGKEHQGSSSEKSRSIRAIARQDATRMPASFWPELTAAAPNDVAPVQEYFFRAGGSKSPADHDPSVRPRSAGRHVMPSGAQRWANAARPAAARGRAPLAATGTAMPNSATANSGKKEQHRNHHHFGYAAASSTAAPMMVNGMGSMLLSGAKTRGARPHTAGATRAGSAAIGLRQGRPRTATDAKRRAPSATAGEANLVASGVAMEPTSPRIGPSSVVAASKTAAAEDVGFGDVICATTPDAVADA